MTDAEEMPRQLIDREKYEAMRKVLLKAYAIIDGVDGSLDPHSHIMRTSVDHAKTGEMFMAGGYASLSSILKPEGKMPKGLEDLDFWVEG